MFLLNNYNQPRVTPVNHPEVHPIYKINIIL